MQVTPVTPELLVAEITELVAARSVISATSSSGVTGETCTY